MPGVVLSAPQVFFHNRQPLVNRQLIVDKSIVKNLPYIPPEIIRIILGLLRDDKKTLAACALVNHTFNLHVTPILYHTVSFSFPYTFTLFANAITIGESHRSRMIHHLDLSSFSTMGLQKSNAAIEKVVTPEILMSILRTCTMLEAFSVSESLESSITLEVLQVLAFECRNLKTLDFCGLSTKQFGSALASLAKIMGQVRIVQHYADEDDDIPSYSFEKVDRVALPSLQRLSLHECPIVSEHTTLLTLLAHAPNLTHLDLGGCSISDLTLEFLTTQTNASKTLTHLLLSKCKNISSQSIASFVFQCESLRVLNLYGGRDASAIINEYDLITILSSPSANLFQTLDLGPSQITPRVLYTIQENCSSALKHLGISKAPIPSIDHLKEFLVAMPNLQYIDLSCVPCLKQLNFNGLLNDLPKGHSLHTVEMDEHLLKRLGAVNGWKINKNKEYHSRRCYYTRQSYGGRPDRIHPRKLDVAESGSERMSRIFKYYSFDV